MIGRLQAAWCAETSYWPSEWSPENPAHGQCAVTALVVQDFLGGDIWRGSVEFFPHYWNHVDGQSIDLTLCQFPRGSQQRSEGPVNRDRLLADPDTLWRYNLLSLRWQGAARHPHTRQRLTMTQTTTEAEPSTAKRVTKALDMACQYSGGIEYGDGPNAELLSWGDIRDVIDQHADLLKALAGLADQADRNGCVRFKAPSGAEAEWDRAIEKARAAIAKAEGQP